MSFYGVFPEFLGLENELVHILGPIPEIIPSGTFYPIDQ
jgi:hypothetical protein